MKENEKLIELLKANVAQLQQMQAQCQLEINASLRLLRSLQGFDVPKLRERNKWGSFREAIIIYLQSKKVGDEFYSRDVQSALKKVKPDAHRMQLVNNTCGALKVLTESGNLVRVRSERGWLYSIKVPVTK